MQNSVAQIVELSIKGMTCSGCTDAVGRALGKVPGVTGVAVDLAAGRARIEGTAEPKALELAVENAGFDVVPDNGGVPSQSTAKGGCCCG